MIRIFLMGYMGAGKTTLGEAFAKSLGVEFIDLDWYIEGRYQQTVSQIFSARGEEGFRKIERSLLHEVGEFENVVISTGGGTPCFFDNMDFMNEHGTTVYLKADNEVLLERLLISRHQRPILSGKSDDELRTFISESLEKREPFYTRAKEVFDSSKLENHAQVAQSVILLKEQLGL